ncbi:hypothetical protein M0R45_033291 [Rubus argutus]|uniref:Uncharacterized protein n=1 Tax=Rubus argutus TaxID=59490 RepID=A0AAW1WJ84_RUBAR
MGFRNLAPFNHSLLAKQGWRLITQPDSLVARVFKARYHPNSSFLEANHLPDMSYTWRSILAGKKVLSKGIRFQIGIGNNVSLWNDPWLPLPHNFKPFSSPREGTESWKVGDIINQQSHNWIHPVISELFSKAEVELILKIPLSHSTAEDRLIWHFDTKGRFYVKSGYHIARITEDLKNQAFSSSGRSNLGMPFWNRIWHACIPPKVRVFIWRLIRGVLPTRVALNKKVKLPDNHCVFCNNHAETDIHVFMQCKAIKTFWSASSVFCVPCDRPGTSICDWVWMTLDSYPNQKPDLFFMCLWVIWCERNKIVWKEGSFNPWLMLSSAPKLLEEYQRFHPPLVKNKQRPVSKWEFPPSGRLKINFDGAFCAELNSGGIGVIVRDDHGHCLAALHRSVKYAFSAFNVEVEACRVGMLFALEKGFNDFILETDSAVLANALTSLEEDFSDIGRIIGDCKDYLLAFTNVNVRHIYREANAVANRLAQIANFSSRDECWIDNTPSLIEDVIYEDLYPISRGIGPMSPSIDLTVVKLLSRKTKEIADVAYSSAVQGRISVLTALLIVASEKVTASVLPWRDSYSGSKENLTIYECLIREALSLVRTPPPWRAAAKRSFTAETENENSKKRKLLLCEIELIQHFGAVAQCHSFVLLSDNSSIVVGDADIIQMLLKENADVNDADAEGNCALHWILKWSRLCPQQIKILLLLLDHGARVSQRNKLGLTAFHIAASHGNLEALKVLILEDPNGVKYETDMKETPLFFAVRHESMDCAKLLLTSGANSGILNLRGQRAIDLAISQHMRYILMKQTSVSLINHAFPSQHKCPALGLTDEDTSTNRHVISSSKAEVANKGKGTTNSAIRTDKSEVVLGVDSRISYAGQRRDTQTKFEPLSTTILATMAGNVAECQKTWTCMKEHVSNNILEGNEPASIYSIATVGYNMERTIDDGACECFIAGVQNEKAEIYHLLDEYKKELKGLLNVNSDRIERQSNNAVELYLTFYDRFRAVEMRTIFLFYIPEIDKKTLRKALSLKAGITYTASSMRKKKLPHALLYDGAERVSNSNRPPFTDWPALKVFQIKSKKIFLAKQSRELLQSILKT